MSSVSDCIVSFVDGRVRLRHDALKNPGIAAVAEAAAGGIDGVTSARVNPVTGSLLVFYEPEKLSREKLASFADEWAALLPEEKVVKKNGRSLEGGCVSILLGRKATRLVDRALLVSLLASLVGAAAGMGTLHRVAGAAFALASVQHLAVHRRALW